MKENVITSILQHDFIFFALSEKIEQSYFCKLLCSRCGLLTRNLNQSTEVVFIFLCGGKNNLKN